MEINQGKCLLNQLHCSREEELCHVHCCIISSSHGLGMCLITKYWIDIYWVVYQTVVYYSTII